MSQVFVSYARPDRGKVAPVVAELERRGWEVFWDSQIEPSQNWHHEISSRLEATDCVLVLWTKNSIRSFWVIEEAMYGQRRGVLLPALLEDVSPPPGFMSLQCADLQSWRGGGRDPAIRDLAEAVEKIAGPPANPPIAAQMEAGPAEAAPAETGAAEEARAFVFEGDSLPWSHWIVLCAAMFALAFGDNTGGLVRSFFAGAADLGPVLAMVPFALAAWVAVNHGWMTRLAARISSKDVAASHILSSLAFMLLLGDGFEGLGWVWGGLTAEELGQFTASLVILAATVVLWLARGYRKSWPEVTMLWFAGCAMMVYGAVFGLLLYFGESFDGYGRLYPRGTGLLLGSALVAVSTMLLIMVKFRHLSLVELLIYWGVFSAGMVNASRIFSISQFGRSFETNSFFGVGLGAAGAMVVGASLLLLWLRTRRGASGHDAKTRPQAR